MTVNEAGAAIVNGIVKIITSVGSAIGGASIGTIIKVGVLAGTAIVTVGLGIRKLWMKTKLWKKSREKSTTDDDNFGVADIATDRNFADRGRVKNASPLIQDINKGFYKKLDGKRKSIKNLTKKDRKEAARMHKRMEQIILGDDYDPDIDYVSASVVRDQFDLPRQLEKKRRNDAYAAQRRRPSDNHEMWKNLHPLESLSYGF